MQIANQKLLYNYCIMFIRYLSIINVINIPYNIVFISNQHYMHP